MKRVLHLTAAAIAMSLPAMSAFAVPTAIADISKIGGYETGLFAQGAAEIVAYDADNARLYVVNSAARTVDVLDIADPTTPVKINQIDATQYGGSANSVAVKNGLVAIAVEANFKQDPGQVVFFDLDGNFKKAVTVGALPDMLTFSADGSKVLVANEGEPNHYNQPDSVDPEGSVSIIDLSSGVENATSQTAGFGAYIGQEAALRGNGVRIYGPNANAAQDFEPEYIALSGDGTKAFVALQENNAIAVIDVATAQVTDILPLGYKNHGLPGNGLDASDQDGAINIQTYNNLYGMYQPDGIVTYEANGKTYLLTANEGDAREYIIEIPDPNSPGDTIEVVTFAEEARVRSLGLNALDPTAFPDRATLRNNTVLGRLTITKTLGDTDGDNDFDELYVLGGRSFSIFEYTGTGLDLVFDSGDEFERIIADNLPDYFGFSNNNNRFDDRSDNKGPEPEDIELAYIHGRVYAFIGLERIGGFMTYDVTDPLNPFFLQYITSRDFSGGVDGSPLGDLGPEGMLFINAEDSPNGIPLLVIGNEVSGSTAIFQVTPTPEPVTASLTLLALGGLAVATTGRRR